MRRELPALAGPVGLGGCPFAQEPPPLKSTELEGRPMAPPQSAPRWLSFTKPRF